MAKRSLCSVLVLVWFFAPVARGATDPESAEENLETFNRAWERIAESHFDEDLNGVDWDSVRDELLPRAEAAQDKAELRAVLQDMVDRLGQSHFTFLPGDDSGTGSRKPPESCDPDVFASMVATIDGDASTDDAGPGIEPRLVDGDLLVHRVDQESPARRAGVETGWEIRSVDDLPLDEGTSCLPAFEARARDRLRVAWVKSLLAGRAGSTVEVEFLDGDGEVRLFDVIREVPSGEIVAYGNLPPTRTRFDLEWHEDPASGRVALARFNIWLVPAASGFDAAMDEMRSADGIVIDLRGNPGGVAAIAMGIAGHFLDEKLSLGTMKSRNGELHLKANPRRSTRDGRRVRPYDGPLAILIDGGSASTSEVFAAGLRDLDRARLFGEPSAGAALPAVAEKLPNGDVFLHATMDFIRPNGERIEGRPLQPDGRAAPTRASLLAGSDPALDAALEWIGDIDREHAPRN